MSLFFNPFGSSRRGSGGNGGSSGTPFPGNFTIKIIGINESIIGVPDVSTSQIVVNDYNLKNVTWDDDTGAVKEDSASFKLGAIDYIPIPENAISFSINGFDLNDTPMQFFTYIYKDNYAYLGDVAYYTDWYKCNEIKYLQYSGIYKYLRVLSKQDKRNPSTLTPDQVGPITLTFTCL